MPWRQPSVQFARVECTNASPHCQQLGTRRSFLDLTAAMMMLMIWWHFTSNNCFRHINVCVWGDSGMWAFKNVYTCWNWSWPLFVAVALAACMDILQRNAEENRDIYGKPPCSSPTLLMNARTKATWADAHNNVHSGQGKLLAMNAA